MCKSEKRAQKDSNGSDTPKVGNTEPIDIIKCLTQIHSIGLDSNGSDTPKANKTEFVSFEEFLSGLHPAIDCKHVKFLKSIIRKCQKEINRLEASCLDISDINFDSLPKPPDPVVDEDDDL